jgi:tight adherence protein B
MRKKVHAISSEGRMSCIVVGALPFAVAFVILLIHRPFYLDVINDPLFWAFIGGGFVLWAVGIVWIWRMVNFKF